MARCSKTTIGFSTAAAGAAVVLTVVLSVTLTRPKDQSSSATSSTNERYMAKTLIKDRFYVGVNIGMINLFPFSRTVYNHTTSELQQMLAVS